MDNVPVFECTEEDSTLRQTLTVLDLDTRGLKILLESTHGSEEIYLDEKQARTLAFELADHFDLFPDYRTE
jgi:hypothetical protein